MCYYNTIKISQRDLVKMKGIELPLLDYERPVQSGFEFRSWPIIRPTTDRKNLRVDLVHWEFIPESVHDIEALQQARQKFTWLNAKAENLFKNDSGRPSMWAPAARARRCLVLSSGFFDFRHVPKIGAKGQPLSSTHSIPYFITLKNRPPFFYMAGIWQEWTNHERGESADTFAIVTTAANRLMEQIHNKKKRMPTILPEDLAARWLKTGISEKEIQSIGSYQIPENEMIAWPVAKDMLNQHDPSAEVHYDGVPEIDDR